MTDNILTIKVLFVEDRYATRLAIKQFMDEYPFICDFAEDYDEFQIKFVSFKPDAIVVDHDLKSGKYHKEIFDIVQKTSKAENRHIGMIGVTALTPFDYIKKQFTSAGYRVIFFDDGTKEFYLDLISEFNKILKILNQ